MRRRRRRNPSDRGSLAAGAALGFVGAGVATLATTSSPGPFPGLTFGFLAYQFGGRGFTPAGWRETHAMVKGALFGAIAEAVVEMILPKGQATVDPTLTPVSSSTGETRMTSDPLTVTPGHTYRATIVTHGLANGASADQVAKKAASLGFTNVTATGTRPPDWPSSIAGDWYVTATFGGTQPIAIHRSNGSPFAGADVKDAWESP